jgi:hypothetical protein
MRAIVAAVPLVPSSISYATFLRPSIYAAIMLIVLSLSLLPTRKRQSLGRQVKESQTAIAFVRCSVAGIVSMTVQERSDIMYKHGELR